MDVLLDDYEEMLQQGLRSFLATECPTSVVRESEDHPLGFPPELWAKLADLGWLRLALPAEYGGDADSLLHLGLVFEEVGRAVMPGPLLSTLAPALAIAEFGTTAQRDEILPAVGRGELMMTWAFTERDPRLRPEAIHAQAVLDGGHYVLSGTKLFVDSFASASKLLVACRTAPASSANAGVSIFVIDTDDARISSELLPTLSGEKQYQLTLDQVVLPVANLLGPLHGGWPVAEWMLTRATALSCAMIVGATRKAVEMAIDYSKDRVVFGRPLGAFQAIQHMCADMITWVDGAQLLTYEALWKLSEGFPATTEVAVAKAFANERCQAALRDANQVHGGIAQIKEFDLQLWYRRASAWTMRLGTTAEHRRTIARAMEITAAG
jgi:alkylation response protein AidB-like acyl-CoA dehydrogenase